MQYPEFFADVGEAAPDDFEEEDDLPATSVFDWIDDDPDCSSEDEMWLNPFSYLLFITDIFFCMFNLTDKISRQINKKNYHKVIWKVALFLGH